MSAIVYLDGTFLPEAEASIGIDNGGWLHGAAFFETMRAEQGRVFRLDAHMARIHQSITKLLRPIDREALPTEDVFDSLLQRNELSSARLRLTVAAGSMRAQLAENETGLTVCITAAALSPYPDASYERGVKAIVSPYRVSPTDPLVGHKSTCYMPRMLGLREAQKSGCAEAIWFTTENYLAEGCISNVFVVKSATLKTPPLDTPVLPGVARSVVLEVAKSLEIPIEETPVTINDLLDADEVLLTNAIMEVIPVVSVERHEIGDGRVGPMAKRLREAYRKSVETECQAK